jgi:Chaperonin GroEL (HSP60 family)
MIGVGPDGRPKNMIDAGAVEPAIVFYSALKRATEAALMMLRIDDMFMTEGSDTHGERGSPHGEYNHSGQTGGGYPWTISH